MSNLQNQQPSVMAMLKSEKVTDRFTEILGDKKKASAFVANVLNAVQNSDRLAKCEPQSIMFAAANAASLDLSVDPNLGHAYLIPYGDKCQFQMGYKGFIQLAIRSGNYERIEACKVYSGDTPSGVENRLKSLVDLERPTTDVIGYAAYFKLLDGFEKVLYMTVKELESHGMKYSKTFKSSSSIWKQDFDAMALKTVIKLLISKYGPKSIEQQRAIRTDQSVLLDADGNEIAYVDRGREAHDLNAASIEEETNRFKEHLKTVTDLDTAFELSVQYSNEDHLMPLIDEKIEELKSKE